MTHAHPRRANGLVGTPEIYITADDEPVGVWVLSP